MDVLAGDTEVFRRISVPHQNGGVSAAARPDHFTAFLRRVVFVGESAPGSGFDFQSVLALDRHQDCAGADECNSQPANRR